MPYLHLSKSFRLFIVLALFAAGAMISLKAERLPIRVYTSADGLARDSVTSVFVDSHGFVWLATVEGISRFDGYQFRNYGLDRGLPFPMVMTFMEARDGSYWAGTRGNVCRFDPHPGAAANGQQNPNFSCLPLKPNASRSLATVLKEDATGVIWCGTELGLYQLTRSGGSWVLTEVDVGLPYGQLEGAQVNDLLPPVNGQLWIAAESGLYLRDEKGLNRRFGTADGLPSDAVTSIFRDSESQLWIGTTKGIAVCQLLPGNQLRVIRKISTDEGLGFDYVTSMFRSHDGRVWVGTRQGLNELHTDAAGHHHVNSLNHTQGLGKFTVNSICEDSAGNIWIGGEAAGAIRLLSRGLVTWRASDGLAESKIESIVETREGELVVINASYSRISFNVFRDGSFDVVHPWLPPDIPDVGWGWNQISFQDHLGEWWIATGKGVLRYPKVQKVADLAHTRPKAFYRAKDGMAGENVFRMYEDHNGDIWFGTITLGADVLSRWNRRTGRFDAFSEKDGIRREAPTAFCEDSTGALWFGQYNGGITRFREGKFQSFDTRDGLGAGQVRVIFRDSRMRLWVGTAEGGIARIDDPGAEKPVMRIYSIRDGISSNSIRTIVEDNFGNLFIGTGRGVDKLNPESGDIRHLTTADGLATSEQRVSFRDASGAIWFGTMQGLSRLIPVAEPALKPPPMVISGLRIGNVSSRISELGEREIRLPELNLSESPIQVEFLGLGLVTEPLKYQYKLEGGEADWSPASDQRTVTLANLAPGSYRFVVRAINAAGMTSDSPATIRFTILPPVWRRRWFLAICFLAAALISALIIRNRTSRLLEIERMRTRIATDLHDDIGASLARIAILSDAVRQSASGIDGRSSSMLGEIAGSARKLLDSMGDIVWSIDPRLDDFSHLISRIRQFASDIFPPLGIAWELNAPDEVLNLKLGPGSRRHFYLIFKEAINNIARHSGCSHVQIMLRAEKTRLEISIADNGKGLHPSSEDGVRRGNGLKNIEERVRQLGGSLDIGPGPLNGCELRLNVPLDRKVMASGKW